MEWLLPGASLALAFANGANDNFKGVATLYGSGQLGYRRALALATASQIGGSLASVVQSGDSPAVSWMSQAAGGRFQRRSAGNRARLPS